MPQEKRKEQEESSFDRLSGEELSPEFKKQRSVESQMDHSNSQSEASSDRSAKELGSSPLSMGNRSPVLREEVDEERSSVHDSQSIESKETIVQRHIGKITGEIIATTLGQGTIFEKIHARAGTNLSSGEGDHITASVVLNEIIHNFLEEKNSDQIMAGLSTLLISLGIEEKNKSGIEEIIRIRKDFFDQNHLTLAKERRYDLTQDLRQTRFIAEELQQKKIDICEIARSSGLSDVSQRRLRELFDPNKTFKEEQVLEVREALKYARKAANAGTIAAISEEIIHVLNHQQNPPSAFHGSRNSNGCHARDENGTMKNLRLFNALCGLVKDCKEKEDEEKQYFFRGFMEDVKSIMRYSSPNISAQATIDKNFTEFMNFFFEGEKFVSRKPAEIDVEWLQQISAFLNTNTRYPEKLGECFNNLYDFGYVNHAKREEIDKDEQILYKSSARHICYILNAFSKLKSLPKEKLNDIKDKFFDEILKPSSNREVDGRRIWYSKGQGWEEREIDMEGSKLNKNHLKENIEKYIDANHRFSCGEIARNPTAKGGR